MKKKKKIGIMLLVATVLLAGYLHLSGNDMSYNAALKANWGITLPYGGEEIYVKKIPEQSFNGDGERFRVFRYDEPPVFDNEIVLSDNVANESRLLEIVENMQADFSSDLSKDNVRCFHMTGDRDARDKLWLIYDEDNRLLYVVEDFY